MKHILQNMIKKDLEDNLERNLEERDENNEVSTLIVNLFKDDDVAVKFMTDYSEILDWETIVLNNLITYNQLKRLPEEVICEILSGFSLEISAGMYREFEEDFIKRYMSLLSIKKISSERKFSQSLIEYIWREGRSRTYRDALITTQNLPENILDELNEREWKSYISYNKLPMDVKLIDKYIDRIPFNHFQALQPLTFEVAYHYFDRLNFEILSSNKNITDEKLLKMIKMNSYI